MQYHPPLRTVILHLFGIPSDIWAAEKTSWHRRGLYSPLVGMQWKEEERRTKGLGTILTLPACAVTCVSRCKKNRYVSHAAEVGVGYSPG